MSARDDKANRSFLARQRRASLRFRHDTGGVVTIEFALLALPFFMLMFGIILVGLHHFTTFSLENAIDVASRQLRTGSAQAAGKTTDEFKEEVCDAIPFTINCDEDLRVGVVSDPSFSGAAAAVKDCLNKGKLIPNPNNTTLPGASGEVIFISLCYRWSLSAAMPSFLTFSSMADGATLIRASTVFRAEPY